MLNENYCCGFIPDKSFSEKKISKLKKIDIDQSVYKNIVRFNNKYNIKSTVIFKFVLGYVLSRYNNIDEISFIEKSNDKYRLVSVIYEKNRTVMSILSELENIITPFSYWNFDSSNYNKTIFQLDNENNSHEDGVGLKFCLLRNSDSFSVALQYNSCNYTENMINSISQYIYGLIIYLLDNADKKIEQLEFLINKDKVLYYFNDTFCEYEPCSIITMFDRRVHETPDETAVIYNNCNVTFSELDAMSNKAANYLKELNVGKNDIVPLYSARSIEMIVGILGILKSGAAYLPVDSLFKLDNLLEDYEPKIILVNDKSIEKDLNIPIIRISELETSEVLSADFNIPEIDFDDLGCCIYTSGSTGKPKGVLLTHRGLLNAVVTNIKEYKITINDIILQYANYAYAQSIIEIFPGLIKSKLCLISDDDYVDLYRIEKVCNDNKVTVMTLTPSLISELNPQNFSTLRLLDSTGEAADIKILKKWAGSCRVVNSFGSTELTGNTSIFEIKSEDDFFVTSIGKPVCNNKYYILDRNNKLCDLYMAGELYISGAGIAKGYLNDPELTQQKFVYSSSLSERLFKTGDVVRWLADGQVEHFGRNDRQIKLKGVRIDLNLIRNTIESLNEIKRCFVTTNMDSSGDIMICAYLTGDKKLDMSVIREKINLRLPLVMVPSFIIQIDDFPLNKNKKIDKNALPKPAFDNENEPETEQTQNSIILSAVLKEVLKLKSVNMNNKFTEIGGDSLKAMRVVSVLNKQGYDLKAANLLYNQSLESASRKIKPMQRQVNEINDEVSDEEIDIIADFYNM